ncbi:MAG: hypothetical protein WEA76_10595 [Acidimicrobiia bacterium]
MMVAWGAALVVESSSVAASGKDLTVIASNNLEQIGFIISTGADYAAELGPGDTEVTGAVGSGLRCLSGDRYH